MSVSIGLTLTCFLQTGFFLKFKRPLTLADFDRKTTTWLILIHVGALLAPFFFTWPAFWTFVGLYLLTGGIGICVCFHRLLTHRSFKTYKPIEYFMTIIGCLTAQRSPIWWVAQHRVHHSASDEENDPHSPKHGFLWSHVVWCMVDKRVENENETYKRYAPDLANDAGHRWIQKNHELFPLIAAVALFLIGGMPFLVWGFFVRSVAVYHATWLVNSAGHLLGYQNYGTGEDSKNNWLLAFLAFGDGWHNNHHAYQSWAKHGHHRWWEFDPSYYFIKTLEFFGLAWDVRDGRKTIFKQAPVPQRPVSSRPAPSEKAPDTEPETLEEEALPV